MPGGPRHGISDRAPLIARIEAVHIQQMEPLRTSEFRMSDWARLLVIMREFDGGPASASYGGTWHSVQRPRRTMPGVGVVGKQGWQADWPERLSPVLLSETFL